VVPGLTPTETATCRITNLRIPTLEIEKTCVGGGGETFSFELSPNDGVPVGPYAIDCGGTSGPIELVPDTDYTLTETGPLPDGWSLTGVFCNVNGGTGVPANGGIAFSVGGGGTVTCEFTDTFSEEPGDGTDGSPDCPVCCACGVDIDIDINNDNTNVIGIENENENENENNNANENENTNENTNTQNQTNDQDQDNDNTQTNNIDSSPEVNISGVAGEKPAPKPQEGAAPIKPPSTGDAGLASEGRDSGALAAVAMSMVLALAGGVALRASTRS
jgi:hypothetical protein